MAQNAFEERLNRLAQSHGVRAEAQIEQAAANRGRTPEWVRNLRYPGSVVGACALGILSVALSRYCMFHINGVPDPNGDPDMTMIVDGALAFAIAFVLRMAFLMTDKVHLISKTVGIWIALTTMHNLVHDFPDLWSAAFSPEWVEITTYMTEPRTLYIRGFSFELSGMLSSSADEPAKPEIKINRF
ncbi:MAG: hypothetical protein AAGL96_11970 [Pseudomonadota bacterium]